MQSAMSAEETLSLADQICKVFKAYDKDGNGKISLPELEGVLQKLNPGAWNRESCEAVFQQMDKNRDGLVDFTEFINYVYDDKQKANAKNAVTSNAVIEVRAEEDRHKKEEAKFEADLKKLARPLCSAAQRLKDKMQKYAQISSMEKQLCDMCEMEGAANGKPAETDSDAYSKLLANAGRLRGQLQQLQKAESLANQSTQATVADLVSRQEKAAQQETRAGGAGAGYEREATKLEKLLKELEGIVRAFAEWEQKSALPDKRNEKYPGNGSFYMKEKTDIAEHWLMACWGIPPEATHQQWKQSLVTLDGLVAKLN